MIPDNECSIIPAAFYTELQKRKELDNITTSGCSAASSILSPLSSPRSLRLRFVDFVDFVDAEVHVNWARFDEMMR
jgi:hypothetical protein